MQGSRFIHRPGRGPSHGAAGDGPRTSERDPSGRDGRAIEGGVGDEGVRKTIEAGRAARGRRAVLGSLALGAGLAAVASTGGCETMPVVAPVFASAAVRLCVALVESVVGGPVDDLPAGYGLPHREKWIVEGQSVEFCLYASPTPGLPVFVQLGCEGPFHEVRARRVRRPDDDGDGDTDRDMVPAATISGSETIPVGDGLSIEKLDCRERLLLAATIARARCPARSTFRASRWPSTASRRTPHATVSSATATRSGCRARSTPSRRMRMPAACGSSPSSRTARTGGSSRTTSIRSGPCSETASSRGRAS